MPTSAHPGGIRTPHRPAPRPWWATLLVLGVLVVGCAQTREVRLDVRTSRPTDSTDEGRAVSAPATRAPDPGGPAIVYARGDYQRPADVVVTAGTDGNGVTVATLGSFNSALGQVNVHRATGTILFGTSPGGGLTVSRVGAAPVPLRCDRGGDGPLDAFNPVISQNGRSVVYGRRVGGGRGAQVRLVGIDGCGDRLLLGGHGRYVDEPLFLEPLGWAADGRRVILVPTSEVEALPRGLFTIDVDSGEVTAVPGAEQGMLDVALSPDGLRVACATLDHPVDERGNRLPIPPNRVEVIDLADGEIQVVAREEHDTFYGAPFWSPDGGRLGYSAGPNLPRPEVAVRAMDFATGVVTTLARSDPAVHPALVPRAWLPGDRVVYTAGTTEPGGDEALWLQDLGTGAWTELDRAPAIAVMGWFE